MKKLIILLFPLLLIGCSNNNDNLEELIAKEVKKQVEAELEAESFRRFKGDKTLTEKVDSLNQALTTHISESGQYEQGSSKSATKTPTAETKKTQSTFSIGDSEERVRAVMGTPTEIQSMYRYWVYGEDIVNFDLKGKVSGYSNNSGTLKVK